MKGEKIDNRGLKYNDSLSKPFPIFLRFIVAPLLTIILLPLIMATLLIMPLAILSRMLFKMESWHKATNDVRRFFLSMCFPVIRNKYKTNLSFEDRRVNGLPLHEIIFPEGEDLVFDPQPENVTANKTGCVRVPRTDHDDSALLEFIRTSRRPFHSSNPTDDVVIVFGGNGEVGDFSLGGFNRAADIAANLPGFKVVYQYNRRNSGASLGRLTDNPKVLIDDAVKFYTEIQKLHPGKQITCMGISIGGWEATELVARIHKMHKRGELPESNPLPKVYNVNSFSKITNVVWGLLGYWLPGSGHILGLFASLFAKMIGLELNSEKAWNQIPNDYKDYQVLQAPRGVSNRYDMVITDFGALHNATSIKKERRADKAKLKSVVRKYERALITGKSSAAELESMERASLEVQSSLQAIKDRKVCRMRRMPVENSETVNEYIPGEEFVLGHHGAIIPFYTRGSHRSVSERLNEFVEKEVGSGVQVPEALSAISEEASTSVSHGGFKRRLV